MHWLRSPSPLRLRCRGGGIEALLKINRIRNGSPANGWVAMLCGGEQYAMGVPLVVDYLRELCRQLLLTNSLQFISNSPLGGPSVSGGCVQVGEFAPQRLHLNFLENWLGHPLATAVVRFQVDAVSPADVSFRHVADHRVGVGGGVALVLAHEVFEEA